MTHKSNREHSFDWELATVVGLEKAILLKNISYWVEENRRRALADYYQHGEWWTRESLRSLAEKYPYFTRTSISRWMSDLCASGWVRMFGQTGGTNFYAPGEVFNAWNLGEDWKALIDRRLRKVSQNGTPLELSQNGTPLSQNGTPTIPKWDTGCPKMGHTNSDIEVNVEVDVEGRRAQKPTASTSRRKSDTSMPSGGAARPTTFAESIWATAAIETFAQALHDYDDTTQDAHVAYYHGRCRFWSAQNPAKPKANWIAFAAQIIGDDRAQQKLVTLQSISSHDSNANSSRPASSKPRFDLTLSSAAQLQAAATELLARRSRRNQYGPHGN